MIAKMPKSAPVLTHLDAERLKTLVAAEASKLSPLALELRRATIIPAHSAPADLVTMNSTVLFEDEEGAAPKEVTIVYPEREDERDAVSVLSPLGTSLLGSRVGRRCALFDGSSSSGALRVLAITYQPEAAGDWHL